MKVAMVSFHEGAFISGNDNDILTAFEFTGLGRGGQQIQKAKEVYTKAVETLVELASLQVPIQLTSWFALSSFEFEFDIDCFCYFG
jgi:hypothetical protein